VKDASLERYVEAIESHLRARRGAEHILSPRDFALARAWHKGGVPLAMVLVGIDRAFDAGGEVSSLSFCRGRVEELVACGPRPRARPTPPAESVPLSDVEVLLDDLLLGLERLQPGASACFEAPLRKIREVRDLIAVRARPNWDYLRGKLGEIDDDVSAAVLQSLTPEELQGFRAEAARAVERHRERVDGAALEDAMSRYALQRAREKLGLRRVSLI
jgi:hypothetical protein